MNNDTSIKPSAWALFPFLVFAVFYVGLSLYAQYVLDVEMAFYRVSMPVAFAVASAVALCFNRKRPLMEKVEAYAKGMGETNIMIMCLIFILAGSFATVAKGSGAVDAAVQICQSFIPAKLMVMGVFFISCLISLAIGTSCGTIAAVTPIALGFAEPLQLSPGLLMGATIGGAMFGDNLSMISDTTIAATRTQGVRMKDKFLANSAIAAPAAVVTLCLYALSGTAEGVAEAPVLTTQHFLLVLPYVLVLALALVGVNVMLLLFTGTLLSAMIGAAFGKIVLFDKVVEGVTTPGALDLIGKGALGMSETLIVALLAGGLFKIVYDNGGVRWLTDKISLLVRGPKTCELGVFLLISAVNLFTANNTVAIVIAGPIAKECADKFKANPVRIASVLDTASCIIQGLIPYGAQILIAIGIAKGLNITIDTFSLISCLYYQPFLAVAVFVAMAVTRRKPDAPATQDGDILSNY